MLTKVLITAGVIAAAVIFLFPKRKGRAVPPRPRREAIEDTVRCEECGAYRLAGEPCLCGHSPRD